MINVLQRALFGKDAAGELKVSVQTVLDEAKAKRVRPAAEAKAQGYAEGEWLDEEEWSTVESCVTKVAAAQPGLETLLLAATKSTPWIAKYKVAFTS
jgi:hypothetical protein